MKKNLAVIFGSKTCEHDISILTALQTIKHIDKEKNNIVPIYIDRNGKFFNGNKLFEQSFYSNFNVKQVQEVCFVAGSEFLHKKNIFGFKKHLKIDVALLCLHGVNGEDGTVQGMLDLCNIPYTSGNVFSSSATMDKEMMKKILMFENIECLDFVCVCRNDKNVIDKIENELNYPLIVKPANLGSSIGINICQNEAELNEALQIAFEFDGKVIVEPALTNFKEINCAVVGYKNKIEVSECEEPISWNKFLSFEDKYLANEKIKGMEGIKRIFPAHISVASRIKIKHIAMDCFKAFNLKGVARIDFLYDINNDGIYVNEINSIPGSLANYLWEFSFTDLIEKLINIALMEHEDKLKNNFVYNSNVLKGISNNLAKK